MASARDSVGYDLSSVWSKTAETRPLFQPYALKPPPGYRRADLAAMERVVRTYMRPGDTFLDSCAGWYTFTCTAAMHGHSGKAADIWKESVDFGLRQWAALPMDCRDFTIWQADALALPFEDGEFDYAFSNTPAFRLSKYSDDVRALESATSLPEWIGKIQGLFVETARVVKPGGLITVMVTDKRDKGVLLPVHTYYLESADGAGLELHDIAVQHISTTQTAYWRQAYESRRTAKAHEYILTFRVPS